MRKPKAPSPTRQRYIASGLIVPDPVRSREPLTADEMTELGFHAAATAARKAPRSVRAR
jgi:hypothetical protein